MDLNMRTIRYFEPILEGSVAKDETADIIVPDMFPDILRIVDTSGLAVVKEKSARDEKAEVFGVVRANVLYMPEGSQCLKKMEVSLPFSHVFESRNITPESKILAKAALLTAEARAVNPRKVQVTICVQLDASIYTGADWGICEDIADAKENSVQMLKSVECAYIPVAVRDKAFTVVDEVEVPGSRPPIVDILKTDVRLLTQEVKPIGNKLVFKGAALMKILYMGPPTTHAADEIALLEQEVPFSQIIEMEGMEDDCDCTVDVQLSGLDLDLRAGLSGESRILGVSLQMDAQAISSVKRKMEAVVDVYSTAYDLMPEFRSYQITHLLDKSVRRQNVRESCETGQPVATVVDAQVVLWPVSQKQEDRYIELVTDAVVKVVYLADDQQFYSLSRHIPVSLQWETDGTPNCKADAVLGSEVLATGTHDGIEIRFAVDFCATLSQMSQFNAIGSVSLDAQAPKDNSNRPSVVLRRCGSGESLWSIAKKHNTTCADIVTANQLQDEEGLCEGRMLLIPRRR